MHIAFVFLMLIFMPKILTSSAKKKTFLEIDGVPYWVYKNYAIELAPILTHRINKVVNNCTPPSTWLKALVTPVRKKTPPIDLSDLRLISVTSIMYRFTMRLIVSKYLVPALPPDQVLDQFEYTPTGSTTAALIAITHNISRLLEMSDVLLLTTPKPSILLSTQYCFINSHI